MLYTHPIVIFIFDDKLIYHLLSVIIETSQSLFMRRCTCIHNNYDLRHKNWFL